MNSWNWWIVVVLENTRRMTYGRHVILKARSKAEAERKACVNDAKVFQYITFGPFIEEPREA